MGKVRGKERSDLVRFRETQLEDAADAGDTRWVRVLLRSLDEWRRDAVVGFEWKS